MKKGKPILELKGYFYKDSKKGNYLMHHKQLNCHLLIPITTTANSPPVFFISLIFDCSPSREEIYIYIY